MRVIALGLGAIALLAATSAAAQNPEEQAIRATIDHYFQGLLTGDGAHYRIAFHPEAKLFQVLRDGKLTIQTSEEYAIRAAPPPADEASQAELRIVSIDQAGTAAVVRVELDLPKLTFVDYMSMLKIEGQWRIINKTSTAIPKPTGGR